MVFYSCIEFQDVDLHESAQVRMLHLPSQAKNCKELCNCRIAQISGALYSTWLCESDVLYKSAGLYGLHCYTQL
jgi:hypothetical protein